MMMPDKFAFEFYQLHLLPVQLPCDPRIEMIPESGKFFGKVYFFLPLIFSSLIRELAHY